MMQGTAYTRKKNGIPSINNNFKTRRKVLFTFFFIFNLSYISYKEITRPVNTLYNCQFILIRNV